MSTGQLAREVKELVVAPFTMEADHPRNCELKLMCIPHRLRSAFNGNKPVTYTRNNGRVVSYIPKDQLATFGSCPAMPGMTLYVNPLKGIYRIEDPLYGDKETCEDVGRWLKEVSAIRSGATFDGAPPIEASIDMHQMKSLCREMYRIITSGEGKVVGRGVMPSIEDIDNMPGKYLLDPGLQVPTSRPRYEDDLQGWVDRLNHSGVGA